MVGWLREWEYAHRGLHSPTVAENSPSAFASAMSLGMGIECDIRLSGDGRAVVFHDATLERLAGLQGAVARLGIAELTSTRLSVGGERIPTLRDLLEQVDGKVPLLLELKTDPPRSVSGLCKAVRRDLEGYQGQVAVMSFDPRVGSWFAGNAPQVVRGLVVTERDRRTSGARLTRHRFLWRAKPHFLAYDVRDLPSPFAASQRARGLPLLTWTVASPALRASAQEFADAPIAEGQGLAESHRLP